VRTLNFYLTDKIRIYPDETAVNKLWTVSYACKNVWNILNEERYNPEVKTNYYSQKKRLPELKKRYPQLNIPSSQVLQEVVKSLNAGWKMFFTKKQNGDTDVKPPRFKSYKYFFTQKYPQQGVSFEIAGNTLRLAYRKDKKDWIEIDLPEREYDFQSVKNVVISYDKREKKWYACLSRIVPVPDYKPNRHIVFFDPGCRTALTGIKTDGTVVEYDINPLRELNLKHYQLIDKLKSLRDKKQKHSKRWRRLNKKISNIYRKIRTQTKHYLHKLANKILDDHPDTDFRVGNWDKQQTLADTGIAFVDKHINRQVQNNNPVKKLVGYLRYKAVMRAQQVEEFDEKGTTKTCSCCGSKQDMPPSKRVYHCPRCGFKVERDINSVLNFLKNYNYAAWHGLSDRLSIARYSFNPVSGANRRTNYRSIVLNYQDARGLLTP
jgi:putative transposase